MVPKLKVKVWMNSILQFNQLSSPHHVFPGGALQQELLPAAGQRGGGEGPGHLLRHTRGGESQSLHKQV